MSDYRAPCLELLEKLTLPPLFASVSGAHLYGFESPDSDVDLRGVICLPLAHVIGLRQPDETVSIGSPAAPGRPEMDFVAHDVRKFCKLMTRHNGYVLEQLYSPLVVRGGPWLDELREIGLGCRTRRVHHHYRGFLGNQMKLLGKGEPTVKELLYAYRVVLTGIHLMRTGEVEAHLPTLLEHLPQPDVVELVERKRAGAEQLALAEREWERHRVALAALEQVLSEAAEASSLPDDVVGFDALDDFVVRARLAHR